MNPLSALAAVAATRAIERAGQPTDFRAPPAQDHGPAGESDALLSAEARLLDALARPTADSARVLQSPLPLLPLAPGTSAAPASELAGALRQGLQDSGLFYEAHLTQWLQGDLPLSQLLAEPQGRLSPRLTAGFGDTPQPAAGARHSTPAAPVSASLDAAPAAVAATVDPRASAIVHQQLQILDNGVIAWQGQVWPGQALDWRVQQEEERPKDQGSVPGVPDGHRWSSTLRLQLPNLGEIEAQLRLGSQGCSVRILVPAAQLPKLRSALPALASALTTVGIRAESIVIGRSEDSSGG